MLDREMAQVKWLKEMCVVENAHDGKEAVR